MLLRHKLFLLIIASINFSCSANDIPNTSTEKLDQEQTNTAPSCSYQDLKNNSQFFHTNTLPLNPKIIDLLKKQASTNLHLLVFLGTWCADSRNIIPLLFDYLEKSQWSIKDKLSLICVDRAKQALISGQEYLPKAMQIEKVPTIIFLRNGKEIQRIVEYGEIKNKIQGLPSQTWEKVFSQLLEKKL